MGELVDNDQEMFPSSPATTKLSGANPVPFVNRVLDSDDGGGGGVIETENVSVDPYRRRFTVCRPLTDINRIRMNYASIKAVNDEDWPHLSKY